MSNLPTTTVEPVRCLLNGNGRIGRLLFRYTWDDPLIDIVQINDLCSCASAAYLLKYDSVHRTWDKEVTCIDDNTIRVDGKMIKFTQHKVLQDLDLSNIELVMECTGKFLSTKTLQPYLDAGIKQVVVSAPVKEPSVLNVVLGCNQDKFVDQPIITNASCTTNCLAPIVKVILDNFGIKHGCITTIHNVTGTQTLVDMPNTKKDDLRRARSGMVNLAPTSTGSATAIVEIYPELKGKLNGLAVRVPLTNASLTDCVFEVNRTVTVEEVNAALLAASQSGPLSHNVLGFETTPLVSTDYTDDLRSSIVDALSTQVIDGTMVKIYSWYDNEAGYSCRMAELCHLAAAKRIRNVPSKFTFE